MLAPATRNRYLAAMPFRFSFEAEGYPPLDASLFLALVTVMIDFRTTIFFLLAGTQMALADDELRRDQIPPEVLAAFDSAYPRAHEIEYDLETENGMKIYEIDFKVGRRKIQVHYRQDGTLLRVDKHKSDDDD